MNCLRNILVMTVAALAERVKVTPLHGNQETAHPANPRDQEIPLSFARQRLWSDQLEPNNPFYNMPTPCDWAAR